jgi:dihydrolipoamide dehydrogenase
MPSKLLIAAADAHPAVQKAGQFGIHADGIRVDGQAVMARVRRERDRFVASVLKAIDKIPDNSIICGMARFVDDHTLMVDDKQRINADRVVIATGSRTNIIPFLKDAGSALITSDDVFDWADLPESVAVFGPGVIGLELGQALARLGVRIRMFGVGGRVGPIQDDDIRTIALETFNQEFPLDADATTTGIRNTGDGVEVSFDDRRRKSHGIIRLPARGHRATAQHRPSGAGEHQPGP